MPKTKAAPALQEELELATRLRLAVMRLARRLRRAGAAEDDVSLSMLSALACIERHQPVALGELAEAERVQPPTMTRIVARLEELGLLTRAHDEADRRVARVRLSPEGVRYVARNRRRKNAYLVSQLRDLDRDEIARVRDAVAVIESLLEGGA